MALLPMKGDSGFTLGGFLILAALGTFMWKGAPLESVRPSSEKSGWYEREFAQQVPARLWQDPFKAVYAHEQAMKAGKATATFAKSPQQIIDEITKVTTRNSRTSGVDTAELTVLMVMLGPGSYSELEERRHRRRYAVLSGLGEEHFVPRHPEVLNVFYSPKADYPESECFTQDESGKREILFDKCYSVPHEWYDYESPDGEINEHRRVLVLWLNESQFVESPLKSVRDFLDQLLPANKPPNTTLRTIVLGPGRSDGLRNLATKEEKDAFKWLRDTARLSEFTIISSTATVADADLIGEWSPVPVADDSAISAVIQRYPDFTGKDCNAANASSKSQRNCLRFLRTIQSDEELTQKLAQELKTNRQISQREDYVVVISEWDTYFGRFLPRAFTKHYCAPNCESVLRYSYLRGMDGIIAGEQKAPPPSKSGKQKKSNGIIPSMDISALRRPVGAGQFDYLRRLSSTIKQKDRELRLSTGHGVKAVVLLGSDTYDKLLILRALRPELPGAVFATTDLNAQLLHPDEYKWTRGLIVASTYDFSLSPDIPMRTMPFRDSYQTSIYLASRLVFNKQLMEEVGYNQKLLYEKIPPQLFEIGRQQLVQLPGDADVKNTWNHVSKMSFSIPVSLGLFTIAVLGIIAFHQLRPMAGRVVLVLTLLLLIYSVLSYVIFNHISNGEPLALLAGASTWPAEYIRIFSVILALVFIWLVIHRLHVNWHNLGVRYFWGGKEVRNEGIKLLDLLQNLAVSLMRPIHTLRKLKFSQTLSAGMVAIMIAMIAIVLPKTLPLENKIGLLILVWGVLIIFWWLTIFGKIWKKVEVLSVNKWDNKCTPDMDASEMWRNYQKHGASEHRFMRTIAYILLYMAFASILFAILGPPSSPCRGDFACGIDKAILGFSVLSMLVLLFLVVDAARLCICWVSSLREQKLDWETPRKEYFVQHLKLSDSHVIAWMKVHLIGERTAEVTRLIYYPVLIILLMLLARSTYFDYWDFPQALAIVVGLNFVIALGSIVRLNFVARSVREDILRNLQEEKLAADKPKSKSYVSDPAERKELISQLEELQIGAYLKVWDQPAVRATLLLLGGVALTFAEYFSVVAP